jgi:GH24 family phage-related lysozyme (muramidase)
MMNTSDTGIEHIKRWEGFRSKLYNDPAGHCTIGYGFLLHKGNCTKDDYEKYKDGISETEATKQLKEKLSSYEKSVNDMVKVPLTQEQFDALVSFTYNIGSSNLEKSDLLKKLNKQDYKSVPDEMMRWVYAGRKKLNGLVNRRKSEAKLFDPHWNPDETAANANQHTVKAGDSLSAIAAKNGLSLNELLELNPHKKDNPGLIHLGETIKLKKTPSSKASETGTNTSKNVYTVKPGDSLSKIAAQHGLTLSEILALNPSKQKNPSLVHPGESIRLSPALENTDKNSEIDFFDFSKIISQFFPGSSNILGLTEECATSSASSPAESTEQPASSDSQDDTNQEQRNLLLETINDVLDDDDVQPGSPDANGNTNTTWCNRAAHRILDNMGYDTSGILDNIPNTDTPHIGYTSANDMAENAANSADAPESGVVEVTEEDARELANQGIAILAVASNPNGHGHVGVVTPSDSEETQIGQAGSQVGIRSADDSFNGLNEVHYYQLPLDNDDE